MDSQTFQQYSELIIAQLKDLQESNLKIDERLQKVELDLARMEARDTRIIKIENWKEEVEKSVGLQQIADLPKDVDKLKQFQAKSTMVFSVVQGFIIIIYFILKLFPKK
jgi:hypothetical protein